MRKLAKVKIPLLIDSHGLKIAVLFSSLKICFISLGIILLFIISLFWASRGQEEVYFEKFFLGGKNHFAPIVQKENTIQKLIDDFVRNNSGYFGIYVKDLKNKNVYGVNQSEQFDSASLYKLAVMYKTFDALQRGELTNDEVLTGDEDSISRVLADEEVDDISAFGGGPTVSFTVEHALNSMITISENYSAILLAQKLGWQNIDALMESENLGGIDIVDNEPPTVTAQAVGDLLEKIYQKRAVSAGASEKMQALLFDQKINSRIPKYLPDDIKVGHKTGELESLRHDAGIVLGKRGHYIFVFLSESAAPEEISEEIAQLSKKIFDALENQ